MIKTQVNGNLLRRILSASSAGAVLIMIAAFLVTIVYISTNASSRKFRQLSTQGERVKMLESRLSAQQTQMSSRLATLNLDWNDLKGRSDSSLQNHRDHDEFQEFRSALEANGLSTQVNESNVIARTGDALQVTETTFRTTGTTKQLFYAFESISTSSILVRSIHIDAKQSDSNIVTADISVQAVAKIAAASNE